MPKANTVVRRLIFAITSRLPNISIWSEYFKLYNYVQKIIIIIKQE